jgi:hypothetical protein
MSDWVVVPCLLVLRDEFDKSSPKGSKRDKGAEGFIGDTKHAAGGTSDHLPDEDYPALRNKDSDHKNEVHAYDCDSTGPWPDGKAGDVAGSWFDKKIKMLIANEKKRWLDPKDMCRLHYIIWRGVIYSTSTDWEGKPYTGADKHFNHAHFSARYETRAEEDTRPWGVYVPPVPAKPAPEEGFMANISQGDFDKLMNGYVSNTTNAQKLADALLNSKAGSKVWPTRTLRNFIMDLWGVRDFMIGDSKGSLPENSGINTGSPIYKAYKSVSDMVSKVIG